jgi:tRNA A58 N-methylase Trm61
MAPPAATSHPAGLLGDSVARDYGDKLRRFAAFAAPELAQAIAGLRLAPGMRVLDAGCGTGEVLAMLAAQVGPSGLAVGVDLAGAHAQCRARGLRGGRGTAGEPGATATGAGEL